MSDLISSVFLLFGSIFMFVSALGIVRMPDVLTRMHTATKAGVLGVGLIFSAVVTHFHHIDTTARAMSAVVFMALTAPVAAHLIGRGAIFLGVKLWKGTFINELDGNKKVSR